MEALLGASDEHLLLSVSVQNHIKIRNVLMTNKMHNSYNKFLFRSFFVCSTCFERV